MAAPSSSRSVNSFLLFWLGFRTCLSIRFLWYSLCGLQGRQRPWVDRFSFFFFFLLIITQRSRLTLIRWSECISKFHGKLYVLFLGRDCELYIYYLVVWSNFNFLQNSQLISFLTWLRLILFSFCARLLHSLIMGLIVLSLSLHDRQFLFCCVLSIFACLVLLFQEIHFLSHIFPFLAMSKSSRPKFCLLVALNVHIVAFLTIFVF